MNVRKLSYVVLIGLLVLLTGCATAKLPPDTVSRIKKVGVMSLTAHELHRGYTGITVFGNEREKQDISAWKVDDEYELQMQSALSKLGLFETVRVPYERKEFYTVYDINGPWDAPAFRKEWVNIEDRLKEFARKHSLDAVVVVIWRETDDFVASSNQRVRGAGLYARGAGDVTTVAVVHLLSSLAVIDGQTGKPSAVVGLTFKKEISPDLARAEFARLDEAKKAEVRAMLIDLPKDSWEAKFRTIFVNDAI